MAIQFITNITEQEFKEFLKDALKEIIGDRMGVVKEQPEIMDVQQAAQFLKMKTATLYEKTSRKQIPHFKKGNKLYFHHSALQHWIKQGKVKTNDEIGSEAITYTFNRKAA